MTEVEVRAAGGLILRDGQVLLIHRPHYGDWSFPKGKLDPGESWGEAAVREVEEEAGLRCRLGPEVGRTHYLDAQGREKEVRYYLMECDGEPAADNEVDQVRWVPVDEAAAVLSYERDRELLAEVIRG
jgi:8-oxo-dGTP diphosphatase